MPLSRPSNNSWKGSNEKDAMSLYQKGWRHLLLLWIPSPLIHWLAGELLCYEEGSFIELGWNTEHGVSFYRLSLPAFWLIRTNLAAFAKDTTPPPSQREPPSLRVLQDLIHDVATPTTTTSVPKVLHKRMSGYISMRSLIKVRFISFNLLSHL